MKPKVLRRVVRGVVGFVCLLAIPFSFSQTQKTEEVSGRTAVSSSHKLGVGDRLSYRVLEDQEPAITLIVTDAGEIDVPYAGRVQVLGRTCEQVGAEVKKTLEKDFYHKATVILAIEQVSQIAQQQSMPKVYLTGQVRKPGPQEFSPAEKNLSRIILRAGGFADFADMRKVRIVRKKEDGKSETIVVDIKAVLEDGQVEKDVEVKDGDLVIVPQRLINW